ncbi:RhoGAP domain-containing protein [Hamiltosporidium tvaerminnensis]|uniref:RhoGAP domain-containing protein n=1 Tax=Hamiltosporidium tvaerminnensis TaxID=1176355 RepID=A0A4Q9LUU4_9MICR|nr:GTPase-activator protein [Hamiltosporidium tvaerminnensis]TBU12354.1 RhoGAP domain-containing protein [Hamiltosporidium tvaerminnensis]TBU19803.1 RhoGAP domain-containing protein [Hamiltosporidium tvaerminnensis]
MHTDNFNNDLVSETGTFNSCKSSCCTVHKRNTQNDSKITNKFFLKYGELTREERRCLNLYSYNVLKKLNSDSTVCKILGYFKNVFNKQKYEDFYSKKKINPFVYEIIEYLKMYGVNQKGIFRVPGNVVFYTSVPKLLEKGEKYDISLYDIHTNASILKAYIRIVLDGIIPLGICRTLVKAVKSCENSSLFLLVKEVFPFSLTDDYRKLLLEMYALFREIDNKKEINLMTMKNILTIFPPTLFPSDSLTNYEVVSAQHKFLELILELDFETVSLVRLMKAKKYCNIIP